MAVRVDITEDDDFFVGEDKSLIFTVKDAADVLQNITGWTIEWNLSHEEGSPSILMKTATLTTPLSGVCTVTVLDTDIDLFAPDKYWHILKRMNAGNETVLSYGDCVLRPAIPS